MGSSNSPFTTKSCACTSIVFLAEIISLSVDNALNYCTSYSYFIVFYITIINFGVLWEANTGTYSLQLGNFGYFVWKYGSRFMRIWFTRYFSGSVERANSGLRIYFHLIFWKQTIEKKKRDVMRDATFISGQGTGVLWAMSSQACSGVARFFGVRGG
jgi:hypothetical protein